MNMYIKTFILKDLYLDKKKKIKNTCLDSYKFEQQTWMRLVPQRRENVQYSQYCLSVSGGERGYHACAASS